MKKIFLAATFLVIAINAIILVAPLVTRAVQHPLSSLPYIVFSPVCHQLPYRSFFLLGQQLPICSRCTGLYLGALFAFLSAFLIVPKTPSTLFLLLTITPLAIDGGTQFVGLRESSNEIRFITGLIAGFSISMLFVAYLYKK